ncbi:RNA polymerase [Flavobacteriales bacterium 33_180_T64]|nr:RNA polymerase [Flavobacteriales bacterium 33_180_T64]
MQSNPEIDFEEILEKNKHKIYRICKVYAVYPIEPQDLFQEVVFQIWKSYSTFKGTAHISTWIYKISLNVCLRSKIKFDKKNSKMVRLESIQFLTPKHIPDESEQEKYQFLRDCISSLNEGDKSIVILYLEDLSYKEIASITGLSENHIAVKMKRIRKKLFDCITPKLN